MAFKIILNLHLNCNLNLLLKTGYFITRFCKENGRDFQEKKLKRLSSIHITTTFMATFWRSRKFRRRFCMSQMARLSQSPLKIRSWSHRLCNNSTEDKQLIQYLDCTVCTFSTLFYSFVRLISKRKKWLLFYRR
jgi:hypothetical protein